MILFLFSLIVVLLFKETVTITVEDPCPATLKTSPIVADMCESSNSLENVYLSGNEKVDSVVLRVQTLQDQCICQLSLVNQSMSEDIAVIKYGGLTKSAPESGPCGLALQLEVIKTHISAFHPLTLNCILPSITRQKLDTSDALRITSRKTEGTFSTGYCLQIYRTSFIRQSSLMLECESKNTTYPTTTLKNKQTTDTFESSTYSAVDSLSNKDGNIEADRGLSQTIYIVIGAGSGVLLIVIIIVVVIILRKSCSEESQQATNYIHETLENDVNTDDDYDGLKYNVLYVQGEDIVLPKGKNGRGDFEDHQIDATIKAIDDTITNDSNPRLKPQVMRQVEKVRDWNTNLPLNDDGHVYSVVQT